MLRFRFTQHRLWSHNEDEMCCIWPRSSTKVASGSGVRGKGDFKPPKNLFCFDSFNPLFLLSFTGTVHHYWERNLKSSTPPPDNQTPNSCCWWCIRLDDEISFATDVSMVYIYEKKTSRNSDAIYISTLLLKHFYTTEGKIWLISWTQHLPDVTMKLFPQ